MTAHLATLLGAARAVAWSRWGAIVRLSTLDGLHWQLVIVDADDTTTLVEGAPSAASGEPADAVELWLAIVHDEAAEASPELAAPRTLADLFPALPSVVTVDAPAAGKAVA